MNCANGCGASFTTRGAMRRHVRTACPYTPRANRTPRGDNAKRAMYARDLAKHRAAKHPQAELRVRGKPDQGIAVGAALGDVRD